MSLTHTEKQIEKKLKQAEKAARKADELAEEACMLSMDVYNMLHFAKQPLTPRGEEIAELASKAHEHGGNTVDPTSKKILDIRQRALTELGTEMTDTCPTCTRPANSPYRRYDARGNVIEGCIDAIHSTAHLIGESARWHNREDAKDLRRHELESLIGKKRR